MRILKILRNVLIIAVLLSLILVGIGTIGLREVKELDIEHIDLTTVDDGTYTGIYENFRWTNEVMITVKNHEIVDIVSLNRDESDSQYPVYVEIMDKIEDEQRNDIDTVSGATATTNAFLKAVEDALGN